MSNPGGSEGAADGLVFVVQTDGPQALGGSGGEIGYDGIARNLVVELDSYDNSEPYSTPHISVHTGATNDSDESYSIGHASFPEMTDGNVHTVRITYATGDIKIFVDGATDPILSAVYDLHNLGLLGVTQCSPFSAAPSDLVCRPAANDCDVADFCDGSTIDCPAADAKVPNGDPCDDGDLATAPDTCTDGVCSGPVAPLACCSAFIGQPVCAAFPDTPDFEAFCAGAGGAVIPGGSCSACGPDDQLGCEGIGYCQAPTGSGCCDVPASTISDSEACLTIPDPNFSGLPAALLPVFCTQVLGGTFHPDLACGGCVDVGGGCFATSDFAQGHCSPIGDGCQIAVDKTVAKDDDCDGVADATAVFGDSITQDIDKCVVYKVCVSNAGTMDVHDVQVTDTIPPGGTLNFGTVPTSTGFYGSDNAGNLFSIDLATGAGTVIGALAGTAPATEIQCNATGCFTQDRDGSLSITQFDINTGVPLGPTVPDGASFTGLEFVGSTLYGTSMTVVGGPSTLQTLNPYSGAAVPIGLTGVGPISGLAYDAGTGVMYGIDGGSGPANLYTIDLITGVATTVGNTGLKAGSLEFGPDGNLYAGTTGTTGGGSLYRIDPASGAATFVGATGFTAVTGLTRAPTASIAPGPTTVCQLVPTDAQVGTCTGGTCFCPASGITADTATLTGTCAVGGDDACTKGGSKCTDGASIDCGTGSDCANQPSNPTNGMYASMCANAPSGGTCALTCDAGYAKSGDAVCTNGSWSPQTCDDINECATNNGGCAQNCTNTPRRLHLQLRRRLHAQRRRP